MFCYKIHTCGNDVLVAACDKDILGKTFFDGELQLEVKESFYKRSSAPLTELAEVLSGASIANLAGNRVVDSAILAGFIDKDKVLVIGGIKHAQFAVLL
jgi:uncharacterized protein